MEKVKFEHHIGMEAYLWIFLHRDMRMKMDSIMLFEKYLEVIVTDFGAVVAYRSDLPKEMRHMVKNASNWRTTEDVDMISEADRCRLALLMMGCRWN